MATGIVSDRAKNVVLVGNGSHFRQQLGQLGAGNLGRDRLVWAAISVGGTRLRIPGVQVAATAPQPDQDHRRLHIVGFTGGLGTSLVKPRKRQTTEADEPGPQQLPPTDPAAGTLAPLAIHHHSPSFPTDAGDVQHEHINIRSSIISVPEHH